MVVVVSNGQKFSFTPAADPQAPRSPIPTGHQEDTWLLGPKAHARRPQFTSKAPRPIANGPQGVSPRSVLGMCMGRVSKEPSMEQHMKMKQINQLTMKGQYKQLHLRYLSNYAIDSSFARTFALIWAIVRRHAFLVLENVNRGLLDSASPSRDSFGALRIPKCVGRL